MDVGKLMQFSVVAEHRHFGRAAEALGVSQQAISKTIALLERDLGVKLFERGAFGAVLTPYGEALQRRAKLIDAELRLGRAELDSMRGSREGHVRIGIGLSFVGRVMPDVLMQMDARHPGVMLSSWVESSGQLFPMLLRGDLDFVVSAPPRQFVVDPELAREPLFLDPDCLFVRAQHPCARLAQVGLADLQPFLWLTSAQMGGTWQAVCRAYTAAGLTPPARVMRLDSTALAKELLRRGDCVALLSRENVDFELHAGRIVELAEPRLGEIRCATLTTRARSQLQPAARDCIAIVREVCQRIHGPPPSIDNFKL